MSTEFPTKNAIPRQWHVIDAEDAVVGKVASKARLSRGKEETKVYRHFTGYPGGLVEKSFKRVQTERPARIIEDAVSGMLPKTKMGKQMYRKLKVYAGDKHPHAAQQPAVLALK